MESNLNFKVTNRLTSGYANELSQILSSIEGEKYLVMEEELIISVDYIMKIQDLKDCEVGKIYRLNRKDFPNTAGRCVFLTRANIASARTITDLIKTNKQSSVKLEFWIVFVPRRLHECDIFLEREGVYEYAKLLEFPLGFIPVDSDLLSLELMDFYSSCFLNNDQTYLHTAATSLVQLQNLCGSIPIICGHGSCTVKVVELMQSMLKQVSLPVTKGKLISHLIVFDRDVDYIPVLLTQMNYEGLLDETYDIKSGRMSFTKEVTGQSKDIKLVLSDDDEIYRKIRNCHFSSVLEKLKESAKELKLKQDVKLNMSLDTIKKIIAEKVKTAPQEKMLPLYMNTCEVIIKEKNKWNFQEHLTTEQNLIAESRLRECISFIEETIRRQAPLFTSLRLMCLLSVTQDGITSKEYKSLCSLFLQSYGHQHMITLHNLRKLGLCIDLVPFYKTVPSATGVSAGKLVEKFASVVSLPKQKSFGNIKKKLSLVPNNQTEIDLRQPSNMSYVFSGAYIPIIGKLTEQVIEHGNFNKFDEVMKMLPGRSIQIMPPSQQCKAASTPQQKKIVLVFILGGITYAEVASLRLLAKLKDFNLLIATTSMLNGNSFMKLLAPLDST